MPAELRAETARVTSIAEHAWERAREQSDFAAFLPHLVRVIELQRRYVECFEATIIPTTRCSTTSSPG